MQRAGYRKETRKVSAEDESSYVFNERVRQSFYLWVKSGLWPKIYSSAVKKMKAGVTRTALCTGQAIKEKVHRVSAQMYLQAVANFFCCKGTDQHVRVRSKMAS